MLICNIDICDYTNKIVCPIYTNGVDISGQAQNVFIKYQRNGWKELSFDLPSVCYTDEGQEENYRLKYVIADYRLRVTTNHGTDWFIISEDGVRHEAFSKKVSVTAGHISRLLKHRSLDLEFSDKEGNNVGTAKELLTTVLESTGWTVGNVVNFLEDDGETIKIRSLNASVKTGAFRLIEMICELFEAKAVYNGDKSVDLYAMNPFSKLEPGEIPEAVLPAAKTDDRYLLDSKVIELHYDKSIKNLERRRNTENISTRLYVYGAFGDATTKYCSVQTAVHNEHIYTLTESYPGENEFQITDGDVERYFTAKDLSKGQTLVWSMLDFNSRRYVWNNDTRIAYKVYENAKCDPYVELEGETVSETNYFPYLSDYTYYEDVGLLTDEMFQSVAAFQRDMADYYKISIARQEQMNTTYENLSNVGVPKSGFLKLDIERCVPSDEGTKLTIRYSEEYPEGVIYRSDYLEARKNYFKWDVAQSLKANGDPLPSAASIVYVLHDTSPVVQWECAYLKDIDGRTYTDSEGNELHDGYDYALSKGDPPKVITLWKNITVGPNDSVYLFCRNSFTGRLGTKFSEDEAALEKLEDKTTLITEKHPTYFVDQDGSLPYPDFTGYGWCYKYSSLDYEMPGKLYFCWKARNDTGWKDVYLEDTPPAVKNGAYFFNTKYHTLWHGESGEWVKLKTVEETEVANTFSIVFMICRQRDKIYKGLYENFYYYPKAILPTGNYAIYSAFGYYWLFTTDQDVQTPSVLRLDTVKGYVYQDDDVSHIVTAKSYPYDTLIYPEENILEEPTFNNGSVYINEPGKNGNDLSSDEFYRSNYIPVWPNETYSYSLPEDSFIVLYDASRNFLSYIPPMNEKGVFSTEVVAEYSDVIDPEGFVQFRKAEYIRIVIPKGDFEPEEIKTLFKVQLKDYSKYCFANDKKYKILSPILPDEHDVPIGINSQIKRFKELSDQLYLVDLPAFNAAQKQLTDKNLEQIELLGDILREGWWQDTSYVEGDEPRMYHDALENLRKIAQPEYTYTFDFLDLYGSNLGEDYTAQQLSDINWPDIRITDAAHLIDPDIKVNQWAYIDTLNKCYDKPWATTIEINTQLSLMGQHDFQDVMSRIAEVASETKAKQTIYQRAESITSSGTISGEQITGEIDTEEVKVTGGSTGWYTDSKGSMVLESPDGLAALRFNGSGLSMASSRNTDGDWEWKQVGNGHGLNAETITTGELNGNRIKANSIRANSLMANVGSELDIGSNKALNLYATMDGVRPSGALKTTDAVIEIKAGYEDDSQDWEPHTDYFMNDTCIWSSRHWICTKDHRSEGAFNVTCWAEYDGNTPAQVNIGSGGSINLLASGEGSIDPPSINIGSTGSINLVGEAGLNLLSGSEINIGAGSDIKIAAGGTFSVASQNFGITEEGDVYIAGNVQASSGSIGGWHVSDTHLGNNEELDDSSVGFHSPDPDNEDDVVLWAGNTDRENAPFKVTAKGSVESSDMAIKGGLFAIAETRTINDKEVPVDNIVMDNDGLKIGRIGDTQQELNQNKYNFTVDKNGVATATRINIINGTIEGCELNGENNVEGGTLTDCTLIGGSVNSSNLDNCSYNRGEIHIGPLDETNHISDNFTVESDGAAHIKKGTIKLGEFVNGVVADHRFKVDEDGTVTITKGTIEINDGDSQFTVTPAGELFANGAVVSGVLNSEMSSKVGGFTVDVNNRLYSGTTYLNPTTGSQAWANYILWNGNADPTSANVSINRTGDIICHNLTVNGSSTNPSSREVKKNIQPIEHREAFDKLNPVSFQYKDSDQTRFGLIYEELQDLYPEVCRDKDGVKGVVYTDLIAVLIKEVQDLRKRISELERK